MNTHLTGLVLCVLIGGLAACSSALAPQDPGEPVARFHPGTDPYWQDPRWDKTFLDAVQAAMHDPVSDSDTSTPGLHATVKFTFMDGSVEYPEIVAGTGNAELDKQVLQQLDSAQLPKASGVDADKPHAFVLDIDVPTPFEAFQSGIYAAIDNQKVYPKDAILKAAVGNTTVDFDYMDGKADDIAMTVSSNSKDLDKASIGAVTRATMPPAPAAYARKSMHMVALFCYSLATSTNGSTVTIKNECPMAKNVILVQGTRVTRTSFQSVPTTRG